MPPPKSPPEKEPVPKIEIISDAQPEVVLKENGRPKFTINLQDVLKTNARQEEKTVEEARAAVRKPDLPFTSEDLKKVWETFAELRRNQMAEYQLLKREFTFQNNVVTVPLSNPIEEPLLFELRVHLIAYLRDKLNNNAINVVGKLEEVDPKKAIYTNREKFDHLAEKNPMLRELKERLGLDTDY